MVQILQSIRCPKHDILAVNRWSNLHKNSNWATNSTELELEFNPLNPIVFFPEKWIKWACARNVRKKVTRCFLGTNNSYGKQTSKGWFSPELIMTREEAKTGTTEAVVYHVQLHTLLSAQCSCQLPSSTSHPLPFLANLHSHFPCHGEVAPWIFIFFIFLNDDCGLDRGKFQFSGGDRCELIWMFVRPSALQAEVTSVFSYSESKELHHSYDL